MTDWRASMAAALTAGGCQSQAEWAARHPGVHCWFDYRGTPSCALCGRVQRHDKNNKPCKGIVTIQLRGAS